MRTELRRHAYSSFVCVLKVAGTAAPELQSRVHRACGSSSARPSDLDSWLERFLQDVFQHRGLVVLLISGAVQEDQVTCASEKCQCL